MIHMLKMFREKEDKMKVKERTMNAFFPLNICVQLFNMEELLL